MEKYIGIIYRYESPSGKSYIGQTNNELKRKYLHKYSAYNEKCKSYNYKFHVAIRKYGFDSFKYEILYTVCCESEEELIQELNDKEIYYIGMYDSYKNGYNMTIGGILLRGKNHPSYGTSLSDEHKEKLKDSVRKLVSLYDLEGNYIASYKSAADAERITGCGASLIIAICRGKAYTSKNFLWRYGNSKENIGKPNIPKSKGLSGKTGKLNPRSKQIYQYTLLGELINIWEGALCAEREQGYSSAQLSKAIKNEKPYGKSGEIKSFWSFIPLSTYEVKKKVAIWNDNNSKKYLKEHIDTLEEVEKQYNEQKK